MRAVMPTHPEGRGPFWWGGSLSRFPPEQSITLQSPTKFIGSQQQFFLLDTSRPQAAKLPPLTLDLSGQQ
jgi:hypothetical protein